MFLLEPLRCRSWRVDTRQRLQHHIGVIQVGSAGLVFYSILLQSAFAFGDGITELPEQLEKAILARNCFSSLRIRYSMLEDIPALNIRREMIREDRFVGQDRISWMLGDKDGVLQMGQINAYPLGMGTACAPLGELVSRSAGEIWQWHKGPHGAGLVESKFPGYCDPRIMGLKPYFGGDKSPDELQAQLRDYFGKRTRWQSETSEHQIQLTAIITADDGKREQWAWWIDPSKQHAVTHATRAILETDGRKTPVVECVTTYRRTQGRWFPDKSIMRLPNGSTPMVIEVISIEFDRPDEPKQLGPRDLGFPVGLTLYAPSRWDHGVAKKWNGEKAIPMDEFRSANPPYDTSQLERMLGEARATGNHAYPAWWFDHSGRMGLANVETTPNRWEDYVRRWCLRYEADDGQRTAARSVLDDCLVRARRALSTLAPRAAQLERELSLLKPGDPTHAAALERKAALHRPVSMLFEELKSRLDEILREPQRKAPALRLRETEKPVTPPVISRKSR